ncbi:hypothetical protein [Maricaulis sp.]|uniref:hypothetical protein n=1 Tax=Maricaulis sp. TaxID=1486257 RepID=UPI00329976CC
MPDDKERYHSLRLVGFRDLWPVFLAFAVELALQHLTQPSDTAVLISRALLVLLSVVHCFLYLTRRPTRVFGDITIVAILAIYLFGQA